jgi:uncharacterized protein YkwD
MKLNLALRPARTLLTAALVTVIGAGSLAAAPSTASAATASTAVVTARSASPALSSATYEQQVQYYVNAQRRKHGLRALTLASCTDTAAERCGAHLAATGGFYHQSMTDLLQRCHARYAGETLGRGQISPQTLVSMWMNSAPHRHVLMSASPTRIGIGSVPNAQGEWVTAANFMRF